MILKRSPPKTAEMQGIDLAHGQVRIDQAQDPRNVGVDAFSPGKSGKSPGSWVPKWPPEMNSKSSIPKVLKLWLPKDGILGFLPVLRGSLGHCLCFVRPKGNRRKKRTSPRSRLPVRSYEPHAFSLLSKGNPKRPEDKPRHVRGKKQKITKTRKSNPLPKKPLAY